MRTHIDLFSGIGGFSLAAESCGLKTVAFAEIDPYASKILKKHWPDVPNFGDVNNVTGISAWLLTGGPPCQPASVAGLRKGASDDRWLWPQAVAAVERIKPAFCLFENPCGFLTLNGGLEFERVLSQLEAISYAVQPIVIPACAVDARHRRDRVWIVAHSVNAGPQIRRAENNGSVERFSDKWTATGDDISAAPESSPLLADSISLRQPQQEGGESNQRGRTIDGGKDVANASRELPHGSRQSRNRSGQPPDSCLWPDESTWEFGSPVCRVSYGIPNRSHRLRCLGNSIVPQVAARIILAMIESEESNL